MTARTKSILTMLLTCLFLVGCGGKDEPDYEDPRVEKMSEEASSLTSTYSEDELVTLMDGICQGDIPEMGDLEVDERSRGYLIGMALATCDMP